MKKIYTFLILCLFSLSFINAQNNEEPFLTITTNLGDGAGYSFYIYYYTGELAPGAQAGSLEVDFGNGKVEFPVTNGSWVENTISGTIGREGGGIVRVYGDPKFIQGLDAADDPRYPVAAIDLRQCKDLRSLYLEHNSLTSLDVSQQENLQVISAGDNKFTAVPDLSNNTKLQVIEFRYNYSIPHMDIDFSQFPDLEEINIAQNNFSSIDVSQNPKLKYLGVYNVLNDDGISQHLSTLDISNNPELEDLWVDTYQLMELDLSNNPKLAIISSSVRAGYGQITSLDVSNNKLLREVYFAGNKLTEFIADDHPDLLFLSMSDNQLNRIDLSNSLYLYSVSLQFNNLSEINIPGISNLASLDLSNNNFRFSTLPRITLGYDNYTYDKQSTLELTEEMIIEGGSAIDLSSEWLVEGVESEFIWYQGNPRYGSFQLTQGEDYVVREGITYFMKVPGDEIYCQMTNNYFSGLTITTTTTRGINAPSGIEGKTTDNIHIAGGKGEIHIHVPYRSEAFIYNLSGGLTTTISVEAGSHTVPVNTPGVYILKLMTEGGVRSYKVAVQ